MAATILLVEDDPDQAFLTARELRAWGFEVFTEYSARDALKRLAKGGIDCVVLDYKLPDTDAIEGLEDMWCGRPELPRGLGLLAKIRTEYPHLLVGVISAHGTDTVAAEALQSLGAKFYISKHGTNWIRILARGISDGLSRAVFQKKGTQWLIAWAGAEAWFPDRFGFRLIHLLLARVGEEFSSADLWAAVCYDPSITSKPTVYDADFAHCSTGGIARHRRECEEVPHPRERELAERLCELEEELGAATNDNDLGKQAKLRAELEWVMEEGRGCRRRQSHRVPDHHTEKTRQSVQKNIKAAIDDLASQLPKLADYLRVHIKTGSLCWYVRDLERPIPWAM